MEQWIVKYLVDSVEESKKDRKVLQEVLEFITKEWKKPQQATAPETFKEETSESQVVQEQVIENDVAQVATEQDSTDEKKPFLHSVERLKGIFSFDWDSVLAAGDGDVDASLEFLASPLTKQKKGATKPVPVKEDKVKQQIKKRVAKAMDWDSILAGDVEDSSDFLASEPVKQKTAPKPVVKEETVKQQIKKRVAKSMDWDSILADDVDVDASDFLASAPTKQKVAPKPVVEKESTKQQIKRKEAKSVDWDSILAGGEDIGGELLDILATIYKKKQQEKSKPQSKSNVQEKKKEAVFSWSALQSIFVGGAADDDFIFARQQPTKKETKLSWNISPKAFKSKEPQAKIQEYKNAKAKVAQAVQQLSDVKFSWNILPKVYRPKAPIEEKRKEYYQAKKKLDKILEDPYKVFGW